MNNESARMWEEKNVAPTFPFNTEKNNEEYQQGYLFHDRY
jgi:hypothetical protein